MRNGQGRPIAARFLQTFVCIFTLRVVLGLLLLLAVHASTSIAAEMECRLRLAWGGESKSWEGTIILSAGEITGVTSLGLEADTPGSMQLVERGVRVYRRSMRSYDGCDLALKTDDKAILIVEFSSGNEPPKRVEVPIAKALKGLQSFQLDDRGSRLLAQRTPGDALRVEFDREHLVLAPTEKLPFRVRPHLADLPVSSTVTLHVQLTPARSDQELVAFQRELKTDASGNVAVETIEIEAPANEGAYDVRLQIHPKRFVPSLTPLTPAIVRPKPLLERRVQMMVVASEAVKPKVAGNWEVDLELDPTNPRWWERLTRMPSLKQLPSFASGPLGNAKPTTRTHLNRNLVELTPDSWQAYPLTTNRIGEPHVLEVEYPSDVAQTLSISIVEPNAAGQVVPLGLDSGIVVGEPGPGHQGKIEKHRLVFWPQTKAPLALLANRRADQPAIYGKLRVLSGVSELEPLVLPDAGQGRRKLVTYFDKPLLAEAFGGDEALDPITRRNLDDWLTFYRGGKRLVEYLRYSGRSSAVIPALCEGSALYPSRRTESTPNYDNGIFFETAQDPIPKDVLELCFRLFDRAGLELIPSLHLATPLTELEQLRLVDPASAVGIEVIGADGKSWLTRNYTRRGMGVFYNPLDPRVQAAVGKLVQEITDRYGNHPSFAGVMLNLQSESNLLLPDEVSSLDDVTILRFSQETKLTLPMSGPNRFAERAQLLQTKHRDAWLNWRSEQLSKWHETLQKQLKRQHPEARLILAGGDLFADRHWQQFARPTLPAVELPSAPWLHLGLQTKQAQPTSAVLFPRPHRYTAQGPTGLMVLQNHWNESAEVDARFSRSNTVMMYHDPAPLRLPSFDEASPFGRDKTHTWFVSHLAPAGTLARRRFTQSLAALDVTQIIDGGWMPIMGQEEFERSWVEVYRQLPAVPFQTHAPDTKQDPATPVVVRSHSEGGQTWLYAVNNSPWPMTLELDVQAAANARWEPLGILREGSVQPLPNGYRLTTTLEPYDLIGARVVGPGATVAGWRSQPAVDLEPALRERIRDTRLRANSLRAPQPLSIFTNPSFERPATKGIPYWTFAAGEGIRVQLDSTQAFDGRQSLRITSTPVNGKAPVVWVRSEPLATPQSGRLSLLAWMRVEDPQRQPDLRLSVEGRWDGKPYYRRANVGQGGGTGPARPLKREWAAFRFPLNDLPLSGLTDLRVGFDLMDEGDVWIDSVQLFDLWLEDEERDELLKNIASAELQLDSQQFLESHRFLESPWPTLVRQFVKLGVGPVATAPPKTVPPTANTPTTNGTNNATNNKGNILNRLRDSMPKWPLR